ncbi:MAG: hypothetical protein L3J89_08840 [Gammaproteobacteria bacterium]|nr:hypothetical protein [Gammaproteobacteria bacterium]
MNENLKGKNMNIHADAIQDNKSQSIANTVVQKQSGRESNFQFVDNRSEGLAQKKLQEVANNSPQVRQLKVVQGMANNQIVQRKYDHLFNDIPKTLSNLPKSLKSPKIEKIRSSLNSLRDDHANGVQDLHVGDDQNATDFGFAQRSFLTAALSYAASGVDERGMREATFLLWKYSSDSDVESKIGNASQKIKLWNSFEKKTWQALTEHTSVFD